MRRRTPQPCASWRVVLASSVLLGPVAGAFPRALRAEGRNFVSDSGEVLPLHAGEMHYFRVPEVYWEDRLQRLRAMGLNAVSTYIAWNWHETEEGSLDFSSERRDVAKFLRLARRQGLLVIFRPGPYICAEWDFGGLPAWLLGRALREGFDLRTGDKKYLAFVDRFWGELLPRVRPELLENGGSLAVLQLENEYGHWGDANLPSDRAYFEHLRALVRQHLGSNVLLITTDDDEAVARGRGGLPDVLAAVNFGPWQEDAKKHLDKVFNNSRLHNGEAPEFVMELWAGWFQMWQHDENTKKQFKVPSKQLLDYVEALLDRNASFTLYMAHGGTNFGLWPSAGFTTPSFVDSALRWHSAFVSTSYDYAAPIAEDGRHGVGSDGVDKFTGLRSLMARYRRPADPALPEEPAPPRLAAYSGSGPQGAVAMRRKACLRDPAALAALRAGGVRAFTTEPQAMELHGQQGGMVLYRHHPADPEALGTLVAKWHSSGSGQGPRFWPRVVVAVLAAAAGTTFLWRRLRCCRCCSVCAIALVAVAFQVHDRWSRPDEAPLVLQARDRVTVWRGDALVQRPYLNLEHVCCPWQVRDLAVQLTPQGSGALDVLVENLGRRAFMPRGYMGEVAGLRHIWYDWKGLVSARIGMESLGGQWEVFALPLSDLYVLNGSAPAPTHQWAQPLDPHAWGPTFFEGEFAVPSGEVMARLSSGPQQPAMTEEARECEYVETHEGDSYVNVQLDSVGSVVWYLPTLRGADEAEGNGAPQDWFEEIEAVLQRVHMAAPKPPKDASSENDRAQYFGVGSYAVLPAAAAASGDPTADSACQGEVLPLPEPAAPPQLWHLRANPRWCQGARPLVGDDLSCILRIKALVEDAVDELLGPEDAQPSPRQSGAVSAPRFNSVLVNRYADGRSQIRWHADDEHCYGPPSASVIASVSLGAARFFELRRKPRKGDRDRSAQQRRRLLLRPGSLLIMGGATQAEWQHSVPADPACTAPRINLTFRRIVGERRRGEESVPH